MEVLSSLQGSVQTRTKDFVLTPRTPENLSLIQTQWGVPADAPAGLAPRAEKTAGQTAPGFREEGHKAFLNTNFVDTNH